ncbi:hypothetical protein ABPG74_014813 [Tetrahymena malaccensis]
MVKHQNLQILTKSLSIKKQTNKEQISFLSKYMNMNFIKSASSTPQEQKLEKLQAQKFISILEQKQIRYLNINENKYLISFLSNSTLIKDMPSKHDIIKILISKAKFIKLDQGQVLVNKSSSAGSNIVSLLISGCLENTNIKTQRNNENANVQYVLTNKGNQQMNFSSVYKLIEQTENSNLCSNEISDIIPFIQTFKKQLLNDDFMKCQQSKQFLFSLDKPFAYNDKVSDQDQENNPMIASKVSFLFQIELQEFLALFEQFLSQIVIITNILKKLALGNKHISTLASQFKYQVYQNKKNIDLENNILVIKHGQIVFYNEGLIVKTFSEQQIVNMDNQQQNKDFDSYSITNPLIVYSLNKKQFEYYNKLFVSSNLNKSEKRCSSSLSNSQIIQDSKQMQKNNSPFNIKNSTTFQFDQRNNQQIQNINNKHQKSSVKRNSLILESSSCLYPTIQENSSQIIQQKKNNNSSCTQRHNLSNSQIRASLGDLSEVNVNSLNKNIINQLISDERQHNQLFSHIQQNIYRFPVPKFTNIKKQLNTNITKCYNFINGNKKQTYCVKDTFVQEKLCKTPRNSGQLSFDDNLNNEISQQNYLNESIFSQNQSIYQSKQDSQQDLIFKSNQGNFSFHDYSSKLEPIQYGSQTERKVLEADNYQKYQQQKTVTVTSFKSKRKPKYSSEKKQNEKLEDVIMRRNKNDNNNYNFILNEQKRSQTTAQRQSNKQKLDKYKASDTLYVEQDYQSKSIFDSTKETKRKSDSLYDSYCTEQTDYQTDTDDITLKQKYDLENINKYESAVKQNSQCKTFDQRQLKCKKKINQYHEIQQQIQWDHLKSKYIKDIISQKQLDEQDNQNQNDQVNTSNTKKEPKQFELNVLQYAYQNQQQELSLIQNSNLIEQNEQQMHENKFFCSDYFDIRQQKSMHTVYLNDSYIDNYKKQITKNYLENQQKQITKNQRNQDIAIQQKTISNGFNFAKSQKINDKLGVIVQNKSQANVQKHFNILNKLLVRNLENANSLLKYAKKRNFSQNNNNEFQLQKHDDEVTKTNYLFNQTSYDFRQNY